MKLQHMRMSECKPVPWAELEWGHGVKIPLKDHKNIGFLSNTGPDTLENHYATKAAFNVWPPSIRQ